jgi:hypothetical protein
MERPIRLIWIKKSSGKKSIILNSFEKEDRAMNKETKKEEKAMAPRSTGLALWPALAEPLRAAVSLFSRVPLALRGSDAL